MRQVEKDLLAAIAAGRPFKEANTAFDPAAQQVTLHGNVIAHRLPSGRWAFNLCGWNTPTTRSRVNALGAGVSSKAGKPHVMGVPVPESGWFHADGSRAVAHDVVAA